MNAPNLITAVRLVFVPLLMYLLLAEHYRGAVAVFLAAGVSDALDGYLARRLKQQTRLGALLDPVADKLIILTAVVLLAWQGLLPLWLAAAVVLRDLVIVAGAMAYRFRAGSLEMAPTWLGKANTVLEFAALALIMAVGGHLTSGGLWLDTLLIAVFVTTVASGLQYVWIWTRKAARL